MIAGALLLATLATCRVEYCAKANPNITACKCYRDDDAYTLRIRKGSRTLYEEQQDGTYGTDTIAVQRLDLDADGKPEIIAADLVTVSNGMGVQAWTLVIVDGRTEKASRMEVEDYGPGSVRQDGVLETSWEWMDGHLYFVARPYKYEHGALVPQKERGMWRRRYLFSFQRERNAGGGPGQWLKKATKVKWVSRDPLQ